MKKISSRPQNSWKSHLGPDESMYTVLYILPPSPFYAQAVFGLVLALIHTRSQRSL